MTGGDEGSAAAQVSRNYLLAQGDSKQNIELISGKGSVGGLPAELSVSLDYHYAKGLVSVLDGLAADSQDFSDPTPAKSAPLSRAPQR